MYTLWCPYNGTKNEKRKSANNRSSTPTENRSSKNRQSRKKLGYRSRSEFIRKAIKHYLENVLTRKIIELREVSVEEP